MTAEMVPILCPICRSILARNPQTWRCEQGHCFDMARDGYVNLLAVQHKKSLNPGDNAEMVKARRDFLAAGHYQPLSSAILPLLADLKPHSILDIGCGEGYYTQAMRTIAPEVIGFDIAKLAVQYAAKRFKDITWLVANSSLLPVADQSIDVISSFFSPLPISEMLRVLKPDGHVLVITPGPAHLLNIRSALFDTVRQHQPQKFIDDFAPNFTLSTDHSISFNLHLNSQDLAHILSMTPYAWRAKPEKRSQILAQAEQYTLFSSSADFRILLFKK